MRRSCDWSISERAGRAKGLEAWSRIRLKREAKKNLRGMGTHQDDEAEPQCRVNRRATPEEQEMTNTRNAKEDTRGRYQHKTMLVDEDGQ